LVLENNIAKKGIVNYPLFFNYSMPWEIKPNTLAKANKKLHTVFHWSTQQHNNSDQRKFSRKDHCLTNLHEQVLIEFYDSKSI